MQTVLLRSWQDSFHPLFLVEKWLVRRDGHEARICKLLSYPGVKHSTCLFQLQATILFDLDQQISDLIVELLTV